MISLHGNWVDLIILIFLVLYSFQGTRRGFFVQIAEMTSLILSFIISLRSYGFVSTFLASNFSLPHGLANALGFIFLAVFAQTIISVFFNQIYRRFPDNFFRSRFNHFLGFLPATIDGLILSAFIFSAIIALPASPSLKSDILSSRVGSKLVVQTRLIEDNLSFLTVKTGSSQKIDLHFRTTNYSIDAASENEMLKLVNLERKNHNVSPLILDIALQSLARTHSQDMLEKGYFSHIDSDGRDPFNRMNVNGINFIAAGENLAFAPYTSIAQSGLMNSPGHKANILNPDFAHIGIGVIDAGVYGKMFTQEFTD